MVRTSPVGLEEVADWENLCRALARASAGKRHRPEVARFVAHWPGELERLRVEILGGRLRLSPLRGFWIRDPKRRWIEAPSFRDRVLHHALVAQIEPVIERRLVDDTFACRRGKGCLKAVLRAQHHLRSNAWCAQVDVVGYYRSIEHARLLGQLGRVFRDPGLLALLEQILVSYAPRRARGLPIGALTSQILGNFYLAPLDRFILQDLRVGGFVRYMDDLTWFVKSRSQASDSSRAVAEFARESLNLELHRHRIQRADRGITLLGFRVWSRRLGLSARRRRRYLRSRKRWEHAYRDGHISATCLQRGYSSTLAITHQADAVAWRRRDLARVAAPDA